MGKGSNDVVRRLARNPVGTGRIFVAVIVASSVVDRHPLRPRFAPATKIALGRVHAEVNHRFLDPLLGAQLFALLAQLLRHLLEDVLEHEVAIEIR